MLVNSALPSRLIVSNVCGVLKKKSPAPSETRRGLKFKVMSIIKDITESHELLKCIAISLLAMPLWYLSIFLIHPDLFERTDLIFKIVFSGVNSILAIILLTVLLKRVETDDNMSFINTTIVSIFIYLIYKSIYLALIYTVLWFSEKQMYYYYYVLGSYSVIFLVLVITLLEKKILKRKLL